MSLGDIEQCYNDVNISPSVIGPDYLLYIETPDVPIVTTRNLTITIIMSDKQYPPVKQRTAQSDAEQVNHCNKLRRYQLT